MTFTSLAFLFFFALIAVVYYLCPSRFRWAVLLLGSCYFYAAFVPLYLLVLFALIVADYFLAQGIEKTTGTSKKVLLVVAIVSNVGLLFVFKYFNFFNDQVTALAHLLDWNYSVGALRLLLPLGLSFHTFQSISYVVEVYRGTYQAERHVGIYALYVMFFPQLIAGPIERPAHLLPQLKKVVQFKWANLESGLRLMAWGFFKKLAIADQLAVSIDHVYKNVGNAEGPTLFIAMIFFAFQLYADFSGYTDIARGAARVLGIELVLNFQQPYFSRSISEFWRRWHISLSTWFRDYFYFPLVYSARRVTIPWLYMCIVATFLVTGFWHGAGWTFILMGTLFGVYIVAGLVTKKWREVFVAHSGLAKTPVLHAFLQTLFTFLLVCIAWVFFRSPNLSVALEFFARLGGGWGISLWSYINSYALYPFFALHISRSILFAEIGCIVILLGVEYFQQKGPLGLRIDGWSLFTRSFVYSSLVLAVILLGSFATPPFLYFQF